MGQRSVRFEGCWLCRKPYALEGDVIRVGKLGIGRRVAS